MKKIKKNLSAILAAAVIFGMAATHAYADKLDFENGILYSYDDNSAQIGKYSGWAETDSVSRRYVDGKPYTGWLKNKDGTYKYVLDGFLVKGEMPIKNTVFTFNENGILINRETAKISAVQDGTVYSGANQIEVSVKAVSRSEYSMYNAEKFERWEKGEWVDCLGKDVEYEKAAAIYDIKFGYIDEVIVFEPERYTGKAVEAGYYRITFPASDDLNGTDGFNVYAVIEVKNNKAY